MKKKEVLELVNQVFGEFDVREVPKKYRTEYVTDTYMGKLTISVDCGVMLPISGNFLEKPEIAMAELKQRTSKYNYHTMIKEHTKETLTRELRDYFNYVK